MNMTWLGVGALGGIIAGGWEHIKHIFNSLRSIAFVSVTLYGRSATAFLMDTLRNKKFIRLQGRMYSDRFNYCRNTGKFHTIPLEQFHDKSFLVSVKKTIMLATIDRPNYCTLTFLRGFDIDSYVSDLCKKWDISKSDVSENNSKRFTVTTVSGHIGKHVLAQKANEVPQEKETSVGDVTDQGLSDWRRIYRVIGYTPDDLVEPQPLKAFDCLYYDDTILEAIQEAETWVSFKEWYHERSIAWKRGWLLCGEPGTGKTAFVRALAQQLDFPVFRFDLATMSNQDLSENWDSIRGNSPCIALFEDIDAVFDKRKNIARTEMNLGVTFDCFLQILDGIGVSDGVFHIITTNHIDKIDPALGIALADGKGSTRPGRVDRVLKFDKLTEEQMQHMAENILKEFPRSSWDDLFTGERETGAQFKDKCCRRALKLLWKKERNTEQCACNP